MRGMQNRGEDRSAPEVVGGRSGESGASYGETGKAGVVNPGPCEEAGAILALRLISGGSDGEL